MTSEDKYILKRRISAAFLSFLFDCMSIFPINKNKIVVSTFEGDGGYCCNPRYIVEELLKRDEKCQIIWLTHDTSKEFPKKIRVLKDTRLNTAYQLSTAKIWIDNYRKPLGTKKRKGQIYIQTWHASLGFKAVGLFRGKNFPKIAKIVSEADSKLIDYILSNSDYCTSIFPKKLLYSGPVLQYGSPRCDCIINQKEALRKIVREELGISLSKKIVLYAPTFRGGNQKEKKEVTIDMPTIDFNQLLQSLQNKFEGDWIVLLRLHPQLSAKRYEIQFDAIKNDAIDVSLYSDISQLISASDAIVTDYSSCAFDASFGMIPVFLYADDVNEYIRNRGQFMWKREELPFSIAEDNEQLADIIAGFDYSEYSNNIKGFMRKYGISEDGRASEKLVDFLLKL